MIVAHLYTSKEEDIVCSSPSCGICNPVKVYITGHRYTLPTKKTRPNNNNGSTSGDNLSPKAKKAEEPAAPWKPYHTDEADPDEASTPKRGNTAREAIFRTLVSVEKELAKLPKYAASLAGFLYGEVGDKTASGNVLARWLHKTALRECRDAPIISETHAVNIMVEENGIIVENDGYQVCINTPAHVTRFLYNLREGLYPALLVSYERGKR